jgi:hypothetical protein
MDIVLSMVYLGGLPNKNSLFDTPRPKGKGILGSPKPLKLDSLPRLAQRWDSPRQLLQRREPPQRTGSQALIRVCPTLFA